MTDPPSDGSLSDSVELIEPSGGGNEMSYAELSIEVDTSGLEVGETYTVSVGAADTRGIEEARALVSFEVIDDEDDGDDGDDGDNGDDGNGDDGDDDNGDDGDDDNGDDEEPSNLEVVGSPWTTGDDHSEVVFTVRNVGEESAEIDAISFDSTSSNAENVNNAGSNEVTFSVGGSLNKGGNDRIPIDGEPASLDESATLEPGEMTDVTAEEFEADQGRARVAVTGLICASTI